MIDSRLIKIASNTKYYGLKDKFTFKTNLKNSKCGDKISMEIIVNKNIIKELRYETESCILCQASASVLADIVKNKRVKTFKQNLNKYLNMKKEKAPKIYKNLNFLLSKKYKNRKDCTLLPLRAFYKAVK